MSRNIHKFGSTGATGANGNPPTVIVDLTSVLYNRLDVDASNLVEHMMKMKATWRNRLDI